MQVNKGYKTERIELRKFDGRLSVGTSFIMGLQHVLAMFFGNIAPILIILETATYGGKEFSLIEGAGIVQATFLMAALGTLLQIFSFGKFGARLPFVTGASFAYLSLGVTLARKDYGLFLGACIVGSIAVVLLGLTARYWRKFVSPITPICVILTTGLSLIGASIDAIGRASYGHDNGWAYLLVSCVSLATCAAIFRYGKGIYKDFYMLGGLIFGYFISIAITDLKIAELVDVGSFKNIINDLGILFIPNIFAYTPQFELGACLTSVVISFAVVAEITGNTYIVSNGGFERPTSDKELEGSIAGSGLASALGSLLFGTLPIIPYSQNSSIVATSKAVTRSIMVFFVIIMASCAFCPPFSTLLFMIPKCVTGGCYIFIFGSILVLGTAMLYRYGLNKRNVLILVLSLFFGLGIAIFDDSVHGVSSLEFIDILCHNPSFGVFVMSILLSHIIPQKYGQESMLSIFSSVDAE